GRLQVRSVEVEVVDNEVGRRSRWLSEPRECSVQAQVLRPRERCWTVIDIHGSSLSLFDAGVDVSTAAVPNAEQQAFDFAHDRRRTPRQDRQRAVTGAHEDAGRGARRLKHRRYTDLVLGPQNISDGVGDMNAVARAGLL